MDAWRAAAFVLAGGEGSRLRPQTNDPPTPALPTGQCRIVLPHNKPQALLDRQARHWGGSDAGMRGEPIAPEPIEGRG